MPKIEPNDNLPQPDEADIPALPPGVRLVCTLRGHTDRIARIAWSPDGQVLASPSDDKTIRLWNAETGECLCTIGGHEEGVCSVNFDPSGRTLASGSDDQTIKLWEIVSGRLVHTLKGHRQGVTSVAFDPSGRTLASGSDDQTIKLWETASGRLLRTLEGHKGNVTSITFDPSGNLIISGSWDNSVKVWDVASGRLLRTLEGHQHHVFSVAFDPSGRTLASGSRDSTIKLWEADSGRLLRMLEGHTRPVLNVAFLVDGQFIASKASDDTIRLWSSDTGACLGIIPELSGTTWPPGLASHPHRPLLATVGSDPGTPVYERDCLIHIYEFDLAVLLGQTPTIQTSHYVNAKAVLLGDTGVGKSGLSMVLNGQPFEATDSTPGRKVWTFQSQNVEVADNITQTRETLLWDLAGQPGYRVIHQLHLNEVAVALVVFDGRSETDPLAGVRHWERALRLAQQRQGTSCVPMKKFLISARNDRGGVSVSEERLQALKSEFGFDGYFKTSAKEGWQIVELRQAIEQAIPWGELPVVSSSKLFADIKAFLLEIKQTGRLVAPVGELYDDFARRHPEAVTEEQNLRDQFDTCIGRLENRDLIRRLSFGGYVLLQPELLDAYASAMVNAAKDEPDGLGSIAEDRALAGGFFVPDEQKIKERGQEQLLLHATIEELARHDLALKESATEGRYLVFPSQFNRDYEDAPEPPGKAVAVTFEGPVQSLYSTLAVRLGHSGLFTTGRARMWRNAAVFTAKAGGKCGLYLHEFAEAHGRLIIFYDQHEGQQPSDETRFNFEEFVLAHAQRRALNGTVELVRFFICANCGDPVPDSYVKRLRERGLTTFDCPCGNKVPLAEPKERLYYPSQVEAMEQVADRQRDFEVFIQSARGETSTPSFTEWAGDERVTLALVFTDVVGSTRLQEELKDSRMMEVRRAYFSQSRKLIAQYKGREIKTFGDSFMVAFRSVEKALDYARALQANPGYERLQIRAGIHIGPIQVEGDDVFGGVVNFAARVVSAIHGAEIWLSDRAKADIDSLGSRSHLRALKWDRLDDIIMKGFFGSFTLWALRETRETGDTPTYAYTGTSPSEEAKLDRNATEAASGLPALILRRVVLNNIRCFENLELTLSSPAKPDWFVLVLGDNATGKTTLLKAIALAFCDEASAAGLLGAPAEFLRSGADSGFIRVEFGAQPNAARVDENLLWVETRLFRVPGGDVKLEQEVSPGLSRKRLFIAGYGPSRLRFGREQGAEYLAQDAVQTLFKREDTLMHPELVLSRIALTGTPWENVAKRLELILHLPPGSVRLEPGGGMSVVGPHTLGEAYSFTSVGDGYLASLNWILDLCGSWMTFANGVPVDSMSGVVLMDEIEQHLHPTWQREVVRALREQFPGIQFIATTHSALCALGTTAIPDESQIVLLRGTGDGVEPVIYSAPNSQSVNQILTSPFFGLFSASSFGMSANINHYAKLKSLSKRTSEQEKELSTLREILEGALGPFEDDFHRKLERLIREVAAKELAGILQEQGRDPEILGFEVRARLRDLFDLGAK